MSETRTTPTWLEAWEIARAQREPDPAAEPIEIWGTIYSAALQLCHVRRVYRRGRWKWVAQPPRGHRTVRYASGVVHYGDIVVQDTLCGRRRYRGPDWYLIAPGRPYEYADDYIWPLYATRLPGRCWRLTIANADGELVVAHPSRGA